MAGMNKVHDRKKFESEIDAQDWMDAHPTKTVVGVYSEGDWTVVWFYDMVEVKPEENKPRSSLTFEVWAVCVPVETPGVSIEKELRGSTTYYCKINTTGSLLQSKSIDGLYDQMKKIGISVIQKPI